MSVLAYYVPCLRFFFRFNAFVSVFHVVHLGKSNFPELLSSLGSLIFL